MPFQRVLLRTSLPPLVAETQLPSSSTLSMLMHKPVPVQGTLTPVVRAHAGRRR
jgi:hypothetical protein